MKKNRKGFTLAELLIVVAIIAVLVAIAIPVFTTQLEKSREATDAANLRAAYAEVMVCALNGDVEEGSGVSKSGTEGSLVFTKHVAAKQTNGASWANTGIADVGGIAIGQISPSTAGWTVTYTQTTGLVTFPAD